MTIVQIRCFLNEFFVCDLERKEYCVGSHSMPWEEEESSSVKYTQNGPPVMCTAKRQVFVLGYKTPKMFPHTKWDRRKPQGPSHLPYIRLR